jgi:hypothetical protein
MSDRAREMAKRIVEAADVAHQFGMIDGAHHKQWVIDQMLQKMLGPEAYALWLAKTNEDPDYEPWDAGIAP